MSNPSWLEKLAPSELQLLRDLADVVKRTVLSDKHATHDDGRNPTRDRTAQQEQPHFYDDTGNTPLKAWLKSRKGKQAPFLNGDGARRCLISLVKAIRVRVQNLSNSLVVRGPDHFFNNKYGPVLPKVIWSRSIMKRAVRST